MHKDDIMLHPTVEAVSEHNAIFITGQSWWQLDSHGLERNLWFDTPPVNTNLASLRAEDGGSFLRARDEMSIAATATVWAIFPFEL